MEPKLTTNSTIIPHMVFPNLMKKVWSRIGSQQVIGILTALIVLANICLSFYTFQSNSRAEKLFMGQHRPLIDVTPVGVEQVGVEQVDSQVMTVFSIVNNSGFKAFNIGLDLKYGDKSWILEWRRARDDQDRKGSIQGVIPNTFYQSRPNIQIPELAPGETIQSYSGGENRGQRIGIIGSLNLENDIL